MYLSQHTLIRHIDRLSRIMSLPVIPERPEDWSVKDIDNLIKILSIESETFDFKGKRFNEEHDELYKFFILLLLTSCCRIDYL